MKRRVWSLKPYFQYICWKHISSRGETEQLFCWCFNVTESQRTDTVIIIINISCNTVICRDRLSSLRVRQTGERVMLEARLTASSSRDGWLNRTNDSPSSAVHEQSEGAWCVACGSSESGLIARLFSPLSWFLWKTHFIQTVMGNLREPLILQRDSCAVAAVRRRWLLESNPRFLTYTAGGNF